MSLRAGRLLALLLAVGLASPSLAAGRAQGARVEGVVVDSSGAPIAGAEVVFRNNERRETRVTDDQGRFVFEALQAQSGTLTVRARGFAMAERAWRAAGAQVSLLNIQLSPAPFADQVTVTAERTETRLADTAASVVVLSEHELAATAALTLDDALRQVAGFSLFRRSGSRTANPTSQGVSLRGVGASGASRAAVLADGVPVNDPFGGWVYWGRQPRQGLGRVEVVRGGASHLYGTDALGGVVSLLPRRAEEPALDFEVSYGNQQTPSGSLFAGGRAGRWGLSVAAEAFHTDGYVLVDEDERGRVDTPAGGQYRTLELTVERLVGEGDRLFARGSLFAEERDNGTPLQTNQTNIRQLALGGDFSDETWGALMLRGYASTQVFDQDFSAVAADRQSESLTRSQRVPAQQAGFSLQWSRGAGAAQTLVAGLDAREVRGASDELGFFAGRLTQATGAGGRERILGLYGQDLIRITPSWLLTVGARIDRWRNYDALSTTRPLSQPLPVSVVEFADRDETAFSPRLSILHRLTDNVSLVASGYRAFRAPTLNELYRSFRVGNVVTLANEDLRAERLTGGEGGASGTAFDQRLYLRGVFFWSEVTRPVANVTLAVTPELITRQRQNLGRTRSRGVEVEAEGRVTERFLLSGGYQFVDATVREFPANRALEGLWIPQVPRHQFTAQARYVNPAIAIVGVQGRFGGEQFDDDRNELALDRYFTLDLLASRPLGRGVEVFAAFENLFDQKYAIGRTPVRTLGPPFLARVGLRVQLGAR